MALIVIKKRQDPIITTLENGKAAQRIFMDDKYSADHRIMIGNISIRKGLIDYIDTQDEMEAKNRTMTKAEQALKEEHLESDNRIRALVKEPIEYRAKQMHIPKILYIAYTGHDNVPPEFLTKVYERQLAFLRENSRDPIADPKCYRDLLPTPEKASEAANFKNLVGARAARLALESYASTMRTASILKLL